MVSQAKVQPIGAPPAIKPRAARKVRRKGKLIVVEGIDGSGKSTQLQLLQKWMESRGHPVFFTEWNSSDLVRQATRRGKRKNLLTPTTFSLIHATDFADRMTYQIIPYLKAGMTVLADRYIYTAFARDVARGVDPRRVREIYAIAPKPDIAFYFSVPINVAVHRLLSARAKIKFYEAGMDLHLHTDAVESFRLFQTRVLAEYDKMATEFNFAVVEASRTIDVQQQQVRELVARLFDGRKSAEAR